MGVRKQGDQRWRKLAGRIVMAGGVLLLLISGVVAGSLAHTGTDGDAGPGYDRTRTLLFSIAPWFAAGTVLWGAGRFRLFAAATVIAVTGVAAGWFGLGNLDAGGSEDSKADLGLVVGSIAALIGLFIAWAGAQLARPSTSRRGLVQNSSSPTNR